MGAGIANSKIFLIKREEKRKPFCQVTLMIANFLRGFPMFATVLLDSVVPQPDAKGLVLGLKQNLALRKIQFQNYSLRE